MSGKEAKERYTDEECLILFACLFSKGFAGEDVLAEIVPEGWMDSTLHFVFHPTLDQVHWERVQLHRNLREWHWRSKDGAQEPEPSLEGVRATYGEGPVETEHEVRELVAMCLWDVFSNEHDVVDREGRLVDIGSWRGATADEPISNSHSCVCWAAETRKDGPIKNAVAGASGEGSEPRVRKAEEQLRAESRKYGPALDRVFGGPGSLTQARSREAALPFGRTSMCAYTRPALQALRSARLQMIHAPVLAQPWQ